MVFKLDAIIFDKDQTLTFSGAAPDPELSALLRKLVEMGKKLFIVSAIGPNHRLSQDEWAETERERKIKDLEHAGINPSLFISINVALPKITAPLATYQEFATAKFEVMGEILERHGLDPKNVLSIGDDTDVEGNASKRLGIKFLCVRERADLNPMLRTIIESYSLPSVRQPQIHRPRHMQDRPKPVQKLTN